VFSLTLIGFLMLTSHLYLWSGSWGRQWNFTLTLSPITPARTARYGTNLVPRHEMVLNCPTKFKKSWNCIQGQIHGKKFKHM